MANLVVDDQFAEAASTILGYSGGGVPMRTLVGTGNGLNVPFFLLAQSDVPEPGSGVLVVVGLAAGVVIRRCRDKGGAPQYRAAGADFWTAGGSVSFSAEAGIMRYCSDCS